ncbi:Olfactory receptor 10J1 [Galemys pyrenaicus]|uniref:Olfactory receptor 10J1 n=1 Tax=Galemys pyrenaicus TaxID=202257 RepID=A0A8J6DIN7_GALPY|nr:Olfactory receptor 10J1 [Galemys pyrenaicus]
MWSSATDSDTQSSCIGGCVSCWHTQSVPLGSLSLVQAVAIFRLLFCNSLIEHFFCDFRPVLDLVCGTPIINDILTLIISLLAITAPATFLFTSDILIISTILKIASAEGQKKAFATCASHLTVVISHYDCSSIAYLKSKFKNTRDQNQ